MVGWISEAQARQAGGQISEAPLDGLRCDAVCLFVGLFVAATVCCLLVVVAVVLHCRVVE